MQSRPRKAGEARAGVLRTHIVCCGTRLAGVAAKQVAGSESTCDTSAAVESESTCDTSAAQCREGAAAKAEHRLAVRQCVAMALVRPYSGCWYCCYYCYLYYCYLYYSCPCYYCCLWC
eukprot:TRINITY_DN4951_c0_g1_i1.p3 TRINITY_DN4951_c0_g1~~TRINITY_DN4951_c0_g1_i1.p3  ORF type:complete len:118 (+),score=3.26 TRINITY_DN4951_c0_g1_i1:159-512(+)